MEHLTVVNKKNRLIAFIWVFAISFGIQVHCFGQEKWDKWYRPVENPVFTINHSNNHDAILFVDPGQEYPYHLLDQLLN